MSATTVSHDHPDRPAFGYEPPAHGVGGAFHRSSRALERAERNVAILNEHIAEKALAGDLPNESYRQMHAEVTAALAYARAVYDAQAEKVRAA